MSTTYINLNSYVNGQPVDLTSVVFSDSGATYGIKRTDTGASFVVAGTAMTRLAQGIYQYSFADPTANLTYEFSIKVVYAGQTYYFNRVHDYGTINNLLAIPAPDTHYSSEAEVLRLIGEYAIELMTEDWEQTDKSPLWEDILSYVDETIDQYITQRYPRAYFTNAYLRRRATILSAHLLSMRRGNPGLYIREHDRILEEFDEIRTGRMHIPNSIPIGNSGPVIRNYMAVPDPHRTQRVDLWKSTGDRYPNMDFVMVTPYLFVY